MPRALRYRLDGVSLPARSRLILVETLATQLGLALADAVGAAMGVPDTEIAHATAGPRFAIIGREIAIFGTDPAALLRGGIPAAAIIVDLSAIVRAVLRETP
ncbi:hypothetical protein DF3PA_350015 [Candidatus Defluviicoccus seviourii]|uniref:Uncharacterized protein n=2 Tax=root TaxID=1 RepID=A0A564WHP2_9PROT|nr:hypothetical protein DF3PB_80033 [uncultured Defluviicoccus sp.]VUX47084.1 hypothetical protein DF3PA_350015 [Candidatus Defluviicoccus seviourii]